MILKKKFLKLIYSFFALLFIVNLRAEAMQSIITIPSSTVLPRGGVIIKETTRVNPYGDKNVRMTPNVTFGTGHGMEFSMGVPVIMKFAGDVTETKTDLSAKKVWYLGSGTRVSVGGTISPSFNMPVCPDTFVFGHVTQRFKKTKTGFTVGGYATGRRHFLNSGGVIIAVDQVVVSNKLNVVAEWASGENNRGRFGAGLKYRPNPELSVSAAVLIPNRECDNIGFQLSLSKYISPEDNVILRRFKHEEL